MTADIAPQAQRPLLTRLRQHRLDASHPLSYKLQASLALGGLRVLRHLPGANPTRGQPDMRHEKLISATYRFVYLPVPKVATKSLRYLFLTNREPHLEIRTVTLDVPSLLEQHPETADFLKFSFVRNPWSRVVSCYHSKIDQQISLGNLAIMSRYPGLKPHMPFPAFVEWLASPRGSDATADRHWLSQHRLLADRSGALSCDFIGKQENLAPDFERLCDLLGLPKLSLPRKNRSAYQGQPEHRPYHDYYDARLRDLVAARYARDIELFGYDF